MQAAAAVRGDNGGGDAPPRSVTGLASIWATVALAMGISSSTLAAPAAPVTCASTMEATAASTLALPLPCASLALLSPCASPRTTWGVASGSASGGTKVSELRVTGVPGEGGVRVEVRAEFGSRCGRAPPAQCGLAGAGRWSSTSAGLCCRSSRQQGGAASRSPQATTSASCRLHSETNLRQTWTTDHLASPALVAAAPCGKLMMFA
eukprot:scaffold73150_cov57-Phaeocystis_antarctica.AAC.3